MLNLSLPKPPLCLIFLFLIVSSAVQSQVRMTALPVNRAKFCITMETIDEAIRKDPGILAKWEKKGEEAYQKALQRKSNLRGMQGPLGDTMIIPVVFHLVDTAGHLAWITDRSIYDQVEILNQAYNGLKGDLYKNVIPSVIYSRNGRIPIRFVLARRAPDGTLTSGIERRVNITPDRVGIKSFASGGLDAWDTDKYLNVWSGSFTGGDDGLLGVATFPFTDTEGPQGVVIGIATLPYTSNVSRSYYPSYSEGGTLAHEIGHYFYLWHTFGDSYVCNNNDFRIQAGWPLPQGAGPEGDDTPEEKMDSLTNAGYGNPSMSYSDGCTTFSGGEMYGSFMNYFDDRALFMFSQGYMKRVAGCIQLYRPDLPNSIGAMPPSAINDAYVVSVSPYGSPERREYVMNNVPMTVRVRNYGTNTLNSVTITMQIDGTVKFQQTFSLSLGQWEDTTLSVGNINTIAGSHVVTVYTSNPNGSADAFTGNDTLQSFLGIQANVVDGPYSQSFSSNTFPPEGWLLWNPNNNKTWAYNATSGFTSVGSASMQNYTNSGIGQLDDLILPAINLGSADSSALSFRYAYAVYDSVDVSTWDGLEIYLSNNGGRSYQLIFKKTGDFLKTVNGEVTSSFSAPPSAPGNWELESIDLKQYIVPGQPLLIKFRGLDAFGNNLYLDDINVSAVVSLNRDVKMTSLTGVPQYVCGDMPSPSISFQTLGINPLTSLKINYQIAGQTLNTMNWTGNLMRNNIQSINLPALSNQPPGAYQLIVYTSNPNGQPDQAPLNDTMKTMFYVMGRATNPVNESFESTQFPPNQWVLQQNGNGHSWEHTNVAALDGTSSVVIKNFSYDMLGKTDNLISPIITGNTGYDSLFVTFDYAYAPGSNYPASVNDRLDTFDVKITMNCGNTFTSVFQKFGNNLVTASDPAAQKGISFVPQKGDWIHATVYLTPLVNTSDFQLFFSSKGNNRNNLYLDNVKVYGVIVPPLLKEKGYLFYPSPFHDQFIIRNFEQPTGLQNVQIFNNIGQLVWQQSFNGDAQKQIFVNSAGWPAGVYTVKMNFTDKKIVDRVVKQ